MLGPRYIEMFMAVMDQGSLSAAARRLGVSQPAVSKAISYLEQRLGLTLFTRVGGRVAPTEAAARLATLGQRVLEQQDRALRVARGLGDRRTLRIATAPGYSLSVLPRVIQAFNGDYPEVSLDFRTMTTFDLNAAVLSERVDFGLAVGSLEDTGLIDDPLATDEVLLLVPRDHVLASRTEVDLAELAGHAHIGVPETRPVGRLIVRELHARGLPYRPTMLVDAFDLGVLLCEQGVAPVLASRIVALNSRSERVALVRLRPAIRYAVVARQRATARLPDSARRFIARFREALAAREVAL